MEANPNDTLMTELGWMTQVENADKLGFFRRLLYKVRPPRELNTAKVPRISADVVITAKGANGTQNSIGEVSPDAYRTAVDQLSANIKSKLSSFTQGLLQIFHRHCRNCVRCQIRLRRRWVFIMPSLSLKNSVIAACVCRLCQIHLWRLNSKILNLQVKDNTRHNFRLMVSCLIQEVDDVFNHGLYEQTKKRITDAASDNGYFDSYWRLHDVKVAQPHAADINLHVMKQASVINSEMLNFV